LIPRLHIVTDDAVLTHTSFLPTAHRLFQSLKEQVALHIRGHALPARVLYDVAAELAGAAHDSGALLIVNDRVDVARAAGVAAVQLGARSLPIADARALLGAGAPIGYSAHSAEEAGKAVAEGADWLLVGSIYDTASHPGQKPAGLALIRESATSDNPVLAIGGITAERVGEVRGAGAYGVALIRAIWHAPDPVQAAEQFAKLLVK
jgi:thiamine-phosphate diphosphorylase